MLEIDFDKYGSNKSSAYRLSVESGDPNFSANLANQIVETPVAFLTFSCQSLAPPPRHAKYTCCVFVVAYVHAHVYVCVCAWFCV